MTTSTAISHSESLPTGAPSSPKTNRTGLIVKYEFSAARPLPLPNSVSLDSLTKAADGNARKAFFLEQARKQLASTMYADEPETLSALRLAAGLSQAQLAHKVSTSQPHIARIERGQTDPSTDVIARIAVALGVDDMSVYRAIRNQLATRGIQT